MARKIQEKPRKSRPRVPYPIVIIACDGAKAERVYFSHFKRQARNKPLHIVLVKEAAGKGYLEIIQAAARAKAEVEGSATVWCVSDVDVNYNTPNALQAKNNQLKKYINEANKHGFNIALSNPCFELWYLLHFEVTKAYLKDYDAIEKKLTTSRYIANYKKNADVYNALADKQTTAISNAEKLKQHHKDQNIIDLMDVATNPYTNIWELAKTLT